MTHSTPRPLNKTALFRTLGYVPHPGQVEVHRSTAERRVVACGVRWGKSLCAGMEAIAAALAPCEQSVGWCVAPTFDLTDRVFREIQRVVHGKLRHRVISYRESDRRLLLRNLGGGVSEIRGKSADYPVGLLGEGLSWVIVDEGARLHPRVWDGFLSQRLLDRSGWALLISTPAGRGWFFEMFQRAQGGDPRFASWNFPTTANPHIDPARVEAERALLPERVFAQEYLAHFVAGEGQVFRGVRECATGDWIPPEHAFGCTAGLDLARLRDYTVLAIMDQQRRLAFVDRFTRIDWALQLKRIANGLARYRNPRTLVDTTGLGDPVFEQLVRAGCSVKPYRLTAASKGALIDNLSMMIEQRLITLPRPELWPEGISELEGYEFSSTDAGNVRMNAPAGEHDDIVIAVGLAAWRQRPVPRRFAIQVLRRPKRYGGGYDYFRKRGVIPLGPSTGARNMP